MILFVMPVVQLTLFGLALSNEVKNVRLAVFADPGDRAMRRLADACVESGWFRAARSDESDPFRAVQSGDADAALVAPAGGLDRALARNDASVQLLVDATNALRARAIENYVQAVRARTFPSDEQPPLVLTTRVLFNPTLETKIFLIPGVMGLILTLACILLTSLSMAREKEMGTFETLIAAPVKPWEIYIGKTLPFVLFGLLDVPLVVGAGVLGFGVPLRGPVWAMGLLSAIFVTTMVSVGMLISTIAQRQQQAMMGAFLFLFPAIQLSGVTVPMENVPPVFRLLRYANPLQYFVVLNRQVMLRGGIGIDYWANLAALTALGGLCVWISLRRFHRTLN